MFIFINIRILLKRNFALLYFFKFLEIFKIYEVHRFKFYFVSAWPDSHAPGTPNNDFLF